MKLQQVGKPCIKAIKHLVMKVAYFFHPWSQSHAGQSLSYKGSQQQ